MKKRKTLKTLLLMFCVISASGAFEASAQEPLENHPPTDAAPTQTYFSLLSVSYALFTPEGYHLHVETLLPGGIKGTLDARGDGWRSIHIERGIEIADATMQRWKENVSGVVMFIPKKIYSGLAFLGRGAKRLLWG